jgi:CubicO group peptidase (beta-lactamase class C family)
MLRLALVAALALGCRRAEPDDTDTAAPGDPFAALVPAIEEDLRVNFADRASIAVWLDGEIVWVGGFREGAVRLPGPDTLFMIGSDTKKITAISLLRRVDAGATSLTTTVGDVLPELRMARAPGFTDATIDDLLTHRGGIVDGAEFGVTTTDDVLYAYAHGPFARDAWPMLPTGLAYNYSNPNFSFAGLLDQELAGRPWPDLVRDEVLAPLGMTRTVVRKAEVDDDHARGVGRSYPSDPEIGPVSLDATWESAYTRPAGLLWSTPTDQVRLARFLVEGDPAVLSDAARERLTSPIAALYPDLDAGGYGHGLIVGRGVRLEGAYYDVPVWSHGGNTLTHTSTFYVLPESRFAISILSNGVGDDFSGTVVAAIRALVDLPAPSEAPRPPFDVDAIDDLVGRYVDPYNVGELIVTRDGNALRASMPVLDRLGIPYEPPMTALSTRVWTMEIQGQTLDLTFLDGPDGAMWIRNRSFTAVRDAGQSFAPVEPSPDDLARWVAAPKGWELPPLLRPPPVAPR